MEKYLKTRLYIALTHYPVLNKEGRTIASSITNLDIHDIARASKTYGVCAYYLITPVSDQKKMAEEIIAHWKTGFGAKYNPKRKEAFSDIHIKDTINDAKEDITRDSRGIKPLCIATTARPAPGMPVMGYRELREKIRLALPVFINFGTAWGLSKEVFAESDYVLSPILGNGNYNHLSVRSAVSVILDRLMGNR